MPKRSKNTADGAVFTYHERAKLDDGTLRKRLPGEAFQPWSHCALGHAASSDPVLTPRGVLYDREAILRCLLHQRQDIRAARERVRDEEKLQAARKRARRAECTAKAAKEFEKAQGRVVPLRDDAAPEGDGKPLHAPASSFWVPAIGVAPAAGAGNAGKAHDVEKAALKPMCPVSKQPLRSKDLITLKPTPASEGDGPPGRYVCPVCQAALSNASRPVALRTGSVLCARCVDRFVVGEGVDPVTSERIDVGKDVIPIFNVGTAFAGSAADDPGSREASLYRPSVR